MIRRAKANPIIAGAAALLVVALLWWFVWWFFIRPDKLQDEAIAARVDGAAAGVQSENAQAAVDATADKVERQIVTERITRENTIRIMAAPGAQDPIPPAVDERLLYALCLRREATQSDPACANVSEPDS